MNRTARLAGGLLDRIRDFIRDNDVGYDDYHAVKQWLIDVGEAGEWPLFLDVFVEAAVEATASARRPGSPGAIEGPYYLPGAAMLEAPHALPVAPDPADEPLVLTGRVTSTDGSPLAAALVDVWQADSHGRYSGFSDVPEGNLRGRLLTGADGRFELETIRPASYTIPLDGPTGRFVAACDWNPWRPAHIHLKVSADGHQQLTTQLTLADSDYIDDDPAAAVKPELIVTAHRRRGKLHVEHEFVLAPVGAPAAVARAADRPAPAIGRGPREVVGAARSGAGDVGAGAAPSGAGDVGAGAARSGAGDAAAAEAARSRSGDTVDGASPPPAWRPPLAAGRAPRFGGPRTTRPRR